MQLYVGETRRTTSNVFFYYSLESAKYAEICKGSLIRMSYVFIPALVKRGDVSTKFECNLAVT